MTKKYVNETFTRDTPNKLSGLGIGKITKIKEWLERYEISGYNINDDLSIDCNSTVMLGHKNLKYLPEFIQFRNILGSFWIEQTGLRSLRGCPSYIEEDFDCQNNDLVDLKFAPLYVEDTFRCFGNHIPSSEISRFKADKKYKWNYLSSDHGNTHVEHLIESFTKGDNKINGLGIGRIQLIKDWLEKYEVQNYTINDDYTIDIKGDVEIIRKYLTKFPDFIQFGKIYGTFNCSLNQLKSLRGSPIEVEKDFYSTENMLSSLEFSPKIVGGNFEVVKNLLKTLKGCPESVGNNFWCLENDIEDSEIDLKYLGGKLHINIGELSVMDETRLNNNPVLEFKIEWHRDAHY